MHQNNDLISRQAAIDALARMMPRSCTPDGSHPADEEIFMAQEVFADCIEALEILPSAAPTIAQTNLCDSCGYSYPECPSKNDDVIFGNGIGNDSICACNKYKPSARPEQRWIPCSERFPEVHETGNSFSGVYMQSYPVLVYGVPEGEEECSFHVVTYCDDLNGYTYWATELDAVTIDGVKAWMPLPEPYRGGEK